MRAWASGKSAANVASRSSIGLECLAARALLQRVEIEARAAQNLDGGVPMQPRLQQQLLLRGIGTHDVVAFAVRRDGRVPAIGRGLRLVHDQGRDRAAARGLLVLVRPPRVVSGRLAAELAVGVFARHRFEVRIVDEVHGNLAAQVDVLVVVPATFRCADAIADEHQRRILDLHAIDGTQGEGGHVLLLHQRAPLAGHGDAHGCVRGHLRAHERHDLHVRAIRPGRLESRGLELLDEVRDGFRLARRARRAPFELVG